MYIFVFSLHFKLRAFRDWAVGKRGNMFCVSMVNIRMIFAIH